MSIIADKLTTLSSDKIENIEKEVSGPSEHFKQTLPSFPTEPHRNTCNFLLYVLYKQPTNIFH